MTSDKSFSVRLAPPYVARGAGWLIAEGPPGLGDGDADNADKNQLLSALAFTPTANRRVYTYGIPVVCQTRGWPFKHLLFRSLHQHYEMCIYNLRLTDEGTRTERG